MEYWKKDIRLSTITPELQYSHCEPAFFLFTAQWTYPASLIVAFSLCLPFRDAAENKPLAWNLPEPVCPCPAR
jgi:hypothetical protein